MHANLDLVSVEEEGHGALAAMKAVLVHGETHTSTAGLVRAVLAGAGHLAVLVNLVELEDRELDDLVVVLSLLGLGVHFFLSLLASSAKSQHQVEGRLLLDVVVGESATVLELLASEDKSLLIRRNSFLVLDLGLDIVDRIGGFDFQGNGLTSERLHENLHLRSTNFGKTITI